MPTRARSFGRSVFRSATEIPSTQISPSWNNSKPFTHLIKVDLPDPDGPHTTTTSPLLTSVEHFFSAWNSPYHFEMFRIEIMLFHGRNRNPSLQLADTTGGQGTNHKIDRSREQDHFVQSTDRVADVIGLAKEIVQVNDIDQGAVLKKNNRLGQQKRDHAA